MKRVLLVDDDHITNFINKRILEVTGQVDSISTALNGQQALTMLDTLYTSQAHSLPELILLDLNMPVMNGFEFLEAYEQLPYEHKQDTKIIIVTSSENKADIDKAKRLGAYNYLNKPLNETALMSAIR